MRPISPSFPITHQSPNILQYFVKIKRQNIHSILRILDSVKPYHPICFASILYADPRLFQSYHPIFHPDIHSLLHIHKSFKQIAQYFFLAIIHFWKYLGVPKLSIFVLESKWKSQGLPLQCLLGATEQTRDQTWGKHAHRTHWLAYNLHIGLWINRLCKLHIG